MNKKYLYSIFQIFNLFFHFLNFQLSKMNNNIKHKIFYFYVISTIFNRMMELKKMINFRQ